MQYEGRTRGKVGRTAVGVSDLLVRVKIFDRDASMCHSGGPALDRALEMIDVRRHVALLL